MLGVISDVFMEGVGPNWSLLDFNNHRKKEAFPHEREKWRKTWRQEHKGMFGEQLGGMIWLEHDYHVELLYEIRRKS